MRRILFAGLFLPMVFISLASKEGMTQNLQFNRVVLKQGLGSVADTVPSGKVWKIEHITCNSSSKSAYYIGLNGVVCNLYNEYSSGSAAYHAPIGPMGPMWLPQGTIVQGGNSGLTYTFSIIEFTVVP